MKRGRYAIHNGNEYQIYNGVLDNENVILLLSHNREDLQNGFILSYSEEYMHRRQFFTCEKEVYKSEITEAYEITPYANYKGFKLYIHGKKSDNMLTLLHTQMISSHSERDREIRDTLIEMGFYVFNVDKFGLTYAKDVPIDDPELEIFEERKEIDISKL